VPGERVPSVAGWRDRAVLVTGAGGFIGSHLVERLVEAGANVRALVRYNGRNDWGHLTALREDMLSKVDVVLGDVTDPFQMDRAVEGRDVVFHLAALIGIPFSYVAPQMYVDVNVRGTVNMLEACRRHRVRRFVQTSTSETYGTAQYTPIDEKHPLQGQSPYSATKIAADKIVESYARSFDLPTVTVRPFNTYGPRQSARAIIPTIITQAMTRDVVELGNADPVRDLTFVTDTAAGFMALADCDAALGREVNLGTGSGIAIGELAKRILHLLGSSARIASAGNRMRPEKSEVYKLIADASLARTLTGWTPRVSLDEGLRATIEHLSGNLDAYRPAQYVV
jgi:NAD dependent epimerase/dehydratase